MDIVIVTKVIVAIIIITKVIVADIIVADIVIPAICVWEIVISASISYVTIIITDRIVHPVLSNCTRKKFAKWPPYDIFISQISMVHSIR